MKLRFRTACEYLEYDDFWLRVIGIPLLALLMPVVFFGVKPWEDSRLYLQWFVVCLFFVWLFWVVNRNIVIYFRKKFPSLKDYYKRILLQSVVVFAVTMAIALVFYPLMGGRWPGKLLNDPGLDVEILATLIVTVMISSIYEAIYGFEMWKRSLVENERLKKERAEAQLISLNNQLRPHFLFNSLNTLIALIPQKPEKAVAFTEELARVYRYLLNVVGHEQLISLGEEIKVVRSFIFLWKSRFGDKLSFELDIPEEALSFQLPPLSLQMLCENAVKHNEVSEDRPLQVRVWAEGDRLLVRNNFQPRRHRSGNGKGLQNIRNRYRFLTEREVEVWQDAAYFVVCIPLLRMSTKN